MNTKAFIEAIVEVVRDATISDVLENLKEPPGRRPHKDDIELSQWYTKLTKEDVENIIKVISKSVDGSVFGVLAVIDGVRAIEDNGEGTLELTYKDNSGSILLNNPNGEYLHDVFNNLTK